MERKRRRSSTRTWLATASVGDDEEATIRTTPRRTVHYFLLVQHYRGRVVDSPGDNLLAEFASVVDAVRSAIQIKQALKEQNTELPEHRRIRFRIGSTWAAAGGPGNASTVTASTSPPGWRVWRSRRHHISARSDEVKNKVALGYEYLENEKSRTSLSRYASIG
jgi:hypothetical protein